MALSKKNLDQLKSLLNKQNKIKNNISEGNTISDRKSSTKDDIKEVNNPNQIFYSIIDNSENLDDTILSNNKLKNVEEELIKENKSYPLNNQIYSQKNNQLSEEDLLYDEFNYLLEE